MERRGFWRVGLGGQAEPEATMAGREPAPQNDTDSRGVCPQATTGDQDEFAGVIARLPVS